MRKISISSPAFAASISSIADKHVKDALAAILKAISNLHIDIATVLNSSVFAIDAAAGSGIKIESDWGWKDVPLNLTVHGTPGANSPSWAAYAGGVYQYLFDKATTEVWVNFLIPHDYAVGTDLHINIHWSQTTVDTGAGGSPGDAEWSFDLLYAKGYDQEAFGGAVLTATVTQTAASTPRQHMVAEVAITNSGGDATHFDNAGIEVGGHLLCRVYRVSSNPADTLDQPPFVHSIGIHYQSTGIATKSKAPNFYT